MRFDPLPKPAKLPRNGFNPYPHLPVGPVTEVGAIFYWSPCLRYWIFERVRWEMFKGVPLPAPMVHWWLEALETKEAAADRSHHWHSQARRTGQVVAPDGKSYPADADTRGTRFGRITTIDGSGSTFEQIQDSLRERWAEKAGFRPRL